MWEGDSSILAEGWLWWVISLVEDSAWLSSAVHQKTVVEVNRVVSEEYYADIKSNFGLSKVKPYLSGHKVIDWLQEWGMVMLICGCATSKLGDLGRLPYFSTPGLGKWHWEKIFPETSLCFIAKYTLICGMMWGFFRQFRIVPTYWLAPFGRLLLHSHWNSGQHSQLPHKVLLCFLHTRINPKSVNTTQLDSGLCYSTYGMSKKGTCHCRNTGNNMATIREAFPKRQWWILALISTRTAKRPLQPL